MPFVARALFYRTSVKGLWLRNAGTSLGEGGNEKRRRSEGGMGRLGSMAMPMMMAFYYAHFGFYASVPACFVHISKYRT